MTPRQSKPWMKYGLRHHCGRRAQYYPTLLDVMHALYPNSAAELLDPERPENQHPLLDLALAAAAVKAGLL